MLSNDNKNYLLSGLAILAAVIVAGTYCFVPAGEHSSSLYAFLFDCMPDAFVALIAIPVVYWLFIRRGIVGVRVDESVPPGPQITEAAPDDTTFMPSIPSEAEKAGIAETAPDGHSSMLVVVDVQHDFIDGSLQAHKAARIIQHVNNSIRIAKSHGMLVVFTRDWHPEDHWSFKKNGGPYKTHCVMDTPGAAIPKKVGVPPESLLVNFGVNPGDIAYSALENPSLTTLIRNPSVEIVYVVGIALNYCVKCTCISIAELGKTTVAIDEAIASANGDTVANEQVWRELDEHGVIRLSNVTSFAEHASRISA